MYKNETQATTQKAYRRIFCAINKTTIFEIDFYTETVSDQKWNKTMI